MKPEKEAEANQLRIVNIEENPEMHGGKKIFLRPGLLLTGVTH